MVEVITVTYLTFMFIALYMFSFFIILTWRNRDRLYWHPKPSKEYSVSVIVPAWNEEDSISGTIEHVCNFDYPNGKVEVIVVNDGSTDGTAGVVKEMQKKYPHLKLIDKDNSGKASSLNIGIAQAKGELIAVVDSDSFPSPDALTKLSGYFNHPRMGAVTSFVKVRNKENNFFAKIQGLEYLILGWSRKLLDFVDSVYVTNGPLSLYRKEYVLKVGGFDPRSITEDIDITWNMLDHGYKTAMCLDAHVTTVVPRKYKAWFNQRTRWGLGGLQALVKYKRMFFRKGMFGIFILPFVSFSIIMSIATFIFSLYLLTNFILRRTLTLTYSISTDSTVFSLKEINLTPSIIVFFFVVLFTLSLGYSWYVLRVTRYEESLNVKKFFNIIFYILVYLTLYPIVWFSAIYRFVRKDYRW